MHGVDAAAGSGPTIDYSNTYDCTTPTAGDATAAFAAGTGNITTDPDFVDTGTDNYNIEDASPCKEGGVVLVGASSTDLAGGVAIVGYLPDIGCYEIQKGWADLDYSERMNHTGTAEATEVVLLLGPVTLSAGAKIKFMGKFSAGDSGAKWLKEKCYVSIYKV